MAIVEKRVKPERMKKTGSYKKRWWLFGRSNLEGRRAIKGLEQVMVTSCGATTHFVFAFMPSNRIFANTLDVFPLPSYASFCALQSRPHDIWARFFGSTLQEGLRYTPTDCFETFPFPEKWRSHVDLEAAGKTYYEFRAELMVTNTEGLTKTYNRFHDPDERDSEIVKLRELHTAMDRAVLAAYGWSDIPTECKFLLEYEIDDEEWGNKKKPWRYRWSNEVHDEVLARLLELNSEYAQEEACSGAAVAKKQARKKAAKHVPKDLETGDLFS